MDLLLSGATGFIGRHLAIALQAKGHSITAVGRKRPQMLPVGVDDYITWHELEQSQSIRCDGAIHLAGENILSGRWSSARKERFYQSRVPYGELLAKRAQGARFIIGASAVGYYPMQGGPYNEASAPGKGFLSELCQKWEASIRSSSIARTLSVRLGVVLGRDGGAFPLMKLPFSLGLGFLFGGPLGKGNQIVPWIHIDDLCQLFIHLIEHDQLSGPFNGVAPECISQKKFVQLLAKQFSARSGLTTPGWLLKGLLGEASSLILEGGAIHPEKALASGFHFQFNDLESALCDLLRRN